MMHRTLLGCCLFFIIRSLSGQPTETGKRISLTDGNELYSWCQAYKDAVKTKGEGESYLNSTNVSVAFGAGTCMGYVRGIVDSLPVGEGFSPGPNVRLSQYVDVVFKYLDEHPELRDRQASILVTVALSQAFPKK